MEEARESWPDDVSGRHRPETAVGTTTAPETRFLAKISGVRRTTPNPVIAVVAEVLGEHYYSHNKLNTLFMAAGAPGEPPEGNCIQKCLLWLKRTNADSTVDPIDVLGGVLLQLMETGGGTTTYYREEIEGRQDRIRRVLARTGLAYHEGGVGSSVSGLPESRVRCSLGAAESHAPSAIGK